MSEESEKPEVLAEAQALQDIAKQLAGLRKEHRKIKPLLTNSAKMLQALTGVDPVEARERERVALERKQAKLYRLAVLLAGVSAFGTIASVVVAIISG